MSNLIWAKIVQLPSGHQVLFTKDYEEDEEAQYRVKCTVELDNIRGTYNLGYTDEETRDKQFEECNETFAQWLLDGLSGSNVKGGSNG